jgi:hypothetical protein
VTMFNSRRTGVGTVEAPGIAAATPATAKIFMGCGAMPPMETPPVVCAQQKMKLEIKNNLKANNFFFFYKRYCNIYFPFKWATNLLHGSTKGGVGALYDHSLFANLNAIEGSTSSVGGGIIHPFTECIAFGQSSNLRNSSQRSLNKSLHENEN